MRDWRSAKWLIQVGLGLILALLATQPSDLSAQGLQQGQTNLLANPGFEGDYYLWQGDGNVAVAQAWQPWFAQPSEPPCYKYRPRYQGAAPYSNRIHSGSNAQQYYTFSASHIAGVYQQVSVAAGTIVRFSIWGQSWTAPMNGDPNHSDTNNPMHLKIGIDPNGGTDPFSTAIVWSGENSAFDAYTQFTIEAVVGNAAKVTVFTYSHPEYCVTNNNVYWDDASLAVIGQAGPTPAPTATPSPTGTPGPSPTPGPTQTPSATRAPGATGTITYVVQAGDTLLGIALQFNTTVAELQRLNNMGSETLITVGQVLIVGEVAITPTATAVLVLPTNTPLPLPSPSPTPPRPTPTSVPGGSICVSAFDDANGNGLRDPGEGLLAGATFALSQEDRALGDYKTAGTGEPHCFDDLPAGSYQVQASAPEGSRATTDTHWTVTLAEGRNESVSLGATRAAQPASQPQTTGTNAIDQLGSMLWRASGILVLLAAVGIAGFIYLSRRA